MKILALEFSSNERSVAIVEDQHPPVVLVATSESLGRTTHALTMIEQMLSDTGLKREEIEGIAVGLGPGSYTGIRAAIALAQGWHLARGVKLQGISSVDCLAAQAQAEAWLGQALFVIDAQRNELYGAIYEIDETGWQCLAPLRLMTQAEAQSLARSMTLVAGPEVNRWFPSGRPLVPSAGHLGRLAVGCEDYMQPDQIEPIYLRPISFVKAPVPRTF
jgi:tRNA threonylcarbamoyladenosine biosynthesis protein TsaB